MFKFILLNLGLIFNLTQGIHVFDHLACIKVGIGNEVLRKNIQTIVK
jgi:hypothetical protein